MRPTSPPSRFLPSLPALVALLSLFALAAFPAAAQPRSVDRAITAMEGAAGAPVTATVALDTGLVAFLTTAPGRPIPTGLTAAASASERAIAFLADHGAAFGILDVSQAEVLRWSPIDRVGMEHVRLQQTFKGIPITGGQLAVHLFGGEVVAVNATTLPAPGGLDLVPVVDADGARAAAAAWLAEQMAVTDAELSTPHLELFNRGIFERAPQRTRLAWFIEARRIDLRQFLWIDAVGGKVLLSFSQLTDARDRQIFDANDPGDGTYASLPGVLVRDEGGAPAVGGAATDGNNAYDFSGDTYDYFLTEHGRDSFDGAGGSLLSTVRFCPAKDRCPFANAFWNGVQMVYGAGFAAADDVAAHELTHAVTEHTANLYYYMQSGALNESYSDIFGETVDLLNGTGTDSVAVRWQMGEDLPGSGAIRHLQNPTIFGDPGKIGDPEFLCADTELADTGGVHSNSGVPNHAYALMVDGGFSNGVNVTGLGLEKVAKIQFRALAHYLLSASDFLDNSRAVFRACQDLVGTDGISAVDCSEVLDAIEAVEMGDPWPCVPAQAAVPDHCPDGQAPVILQSFDWENGLFVACPSDVLFRGWCTNGPASLFGPFATSGVHSLWDYSQPKAEVHSLNSGFITLPPNARFQFNHAYGFENTGASYFDGAVVEVSTDGGSSWSDAGPLISAGQAYGGTLSSCCSNELGGRAAFVGESRGYTATQLDLSSLAPSTEFKWRFIASTDSSLDDLGWFLDDLRLYTCSDCEVNRVLDSTYNGVASVYRASDTVTAGDGFTVGLAEDVTFEAGSSIVLSDGFRVAGGSFTATIAAVPCP